MPGTPTVEQFTGCLLGLAVDDAVGAPYEGLNADNLFWGFGSPAELLQNAGREPLNFTDDTEMVVGVAETLVEHGRLIRWITNDRENRDAGRTAADLVVRR